MFEARNGPGWNLTFDEFAATILSARHETGMPRRSWTADNRSHPRADQRSTVDFVAKNYELFGYDFDDLAAMKLSDFGTQQLAGKGPRIRKLIGTE